MLTGAFVKSRIRSAALVLVGGSIVFAAAGVQENDWVIVPGKRVGPITTTATRADLVRLFGGGHVSDSEILKTDFGTETGTIVFGEQPELSLAIFWKTEAPDSRIRRIRFCPNVEIPVKCRWHTAEGITIGTSLKQLEQLNGHPFQLNGFDWGYGGLITSWQGGRLEKLAATCGGLTVRLDPPPGQATDERAQLLDVLDGDQDFASSHSAMQGLNPVVDFISFSFQNCR